MIKIRRNCKEIEGKSFGARKSVKTGEKQGSARFRNLKEASAKSALCCETISQPQEVAGKTPLCCKMISQPHTPPLRNHLLAHECHFAAQYPHFAAAKWLRNPQSVKSPIFAAKAPFRRVFRSCETTLWHTSAISQPRTLISQLRNDCEISTHHEGNVAAASLLDTFQSTS